MFLHLGKQPNLRPEGPEIYTLQADIHIAKFNVTWNHPTHDVLLTRDEAPLGFVVV